MKKSILFLLALVIITVLLSSCIASFPTTEKVVSLTNEQATDLLREKTQKEIRDNWGEPDSFLSGLYGDIYTFRDKMVVVYYDFGSKKIIDVVIAYRQIEEEVEENWYEYPVTPKSEEWKNMTVQEKLQACRIPRETLSNLSDTALVKAITDYPFFVDLYVYDSIEYAVKIFPDQCDAYKEILSRKDSGWVMLNGLRNLPTNTDAERDHYNHDTLGMLVLFDSRLDGSYTSDEIVEIANHTCAALIINKGEDKNYGNYFDSHDIVLADGRTVTVLWFPDGRPEGIDSSAIK